MCGLLGRLMAAVRGEGRKPLGSLPNEIESDDQMHHLCHVRNAGRFVLLARDSLPKADLVSKDTGRNEPGSVDGPTVITPSTTRAG